MLSKAAGGDGAFSTKKRKESKAERLIRQAKEATQLDEVQDREPRSTKVKKESDDRSEPEPEPEPKRKGGKDARARNDSSSRRTGDDDENDGGQQQEQLEKTKTAEKNPEKNRETLKTRKIPNKNRKDQSSDSDDDEDHNAREDDEKQEEQRKRKKCRERVVEEDDTDTDQDEESRGEGEHDSGKRESDDEGDASLGGLMALAPKLAPQQRPLTGARRLGLLREVVPAWMKAPQLIDPDAQLALEGLGLHPALERNLRAAGCSALFPVQAAVLPHLLRNRLGAVRWQCQRDICVASPTGSGKTLTYAIPLVQTLLGRVVRRLRGLVLVPTRDLALQVGEVLRGLCEGTALRVRVAGGQMSYAEEKAMLAPGVDVLVATPGRLIEHLVHTPDFSLQDLQFVVLDEADRLLSQAYQNWISHIHLATDSPQGGGAGGVAEQGPRLRKLLFSATLTRNPSKLAPLRLREPLYFSGRDVRYQTPKELEEFMVPCQGGERPLVLLHLLAKHSYCPTICFTNTLDACHRLFRLLELFQDRCRVAQFSSQLPQRQRSQIVADMASGAVTLLVCSDAMARGMDLPGVDLVINYDMPSYIKTYVHRVGRTARAGRGGKCYTLLESSEVKKFKGLLRLADNNYVRSVRIREGDLEPLERRYKEALGRLRSVMEEERAGRQDALAELSADARRGGGPAPAHAHAEAAVAPAAPRSRSERDPEERGGGGGGAGAEGAAREERGREERAAGKRGRSEQSGGREREGGGGREGAGGRGGGGEAPAKKKKESKAERLRRQLEGA